MNQFTPSLSLAYMKKWLLSLAALALLVPHPSFAQDKFRTATGQVSFYSASIIEDIDAHNKAVAAAVDISTGQVAFVVPIKAFVFKRALMQEHFNENYLESDKYPKATFTGRYTGISTAALTAGGARRIRVAGKFSLHGVTRSITAEGTLELKNGQLLVFSDFVLAPADYNIEIPRLVRDNIAKAVSVRLVVACDPQQGS